ncbi:hypothetical protein PS2_023413 [Malus domestica]
MARIKRVTADAGENFGRRILFPEASAGGVVVEGEGGESGDGGDEVGVGSGLDPCEVLDGEFGGGGVGIEPEDGRLEAEVKEGDVAWRSPVARKRWELEGSVERRSRRRGSGVQRTKVTKGERDDDVEEDWVGGGIGMLTTSCIERALRTEMELPEGNARRPERLRSVDPKLLRLGGPGSMQSQ